MQGGYDIRLGEVGRAALKKEISRRLKGDAQLRERSSNGYIFNCSLFVLYLFFICSSFVLYFCRCVSVVCRLKNANVLQLLQMAEISGCLDMVIYRSSIVISFIIDRVSFNHDSSSKFFQGLEISSKYWKEYSRKQRPGVVVGGKREKIEYMNRNRYSSRISKSLETPLYGRSDQLDLSPAESSSSPLSPLALMYQPQTTTLIRADEDFHLSKDDYGTSINNITSINTSPSFLLDTSSVRPIKSTHHLSPDSKQEMGFDNIQFETKVGDNYLLQNDISNNRAPLPGVFSSADYVLTDSAAGGSRKRPRHHSESLTVGFNPDVENPPDDGRCSNVREASLLMNVRNDSGRLGGFNNGRHQPYYSSPSPTLLSRPPFETASDITNDEQRDSVNSPDSSEFDKLHHHVAKKQRLDDYESHHESLEHDGSMVCYDRPFGERNFTNSDDGEQNSFGDYPWWCSILEPPNHFLHNSCNSSGSTPVSGCCPPNVRPVLSNSEETWIDRSHDVNSFNTSSSEGDSGGLIGVPSDFLVNPGSATTISGQQLKWFIWELWELNWLERESSISVNAPFFVQSLKESTETSCCGLLLR